MFLLCQAPFSCHLYLSLFGTLPHITESTSVPPCILYTICVPHCLSDTPVAAFSGKQGWLYKQGGKHKSWKRRYFILSPGAFAYYKKQGDKAAQGEVKLKNLKVFYPAVGEREQSFQFVVHTESSWNKRDDYVIAAQSEFEMKEWVEAFKLAGQKNTRHSSEDQLKK